MHGLNPTRLVYSFLLAGVLVMIALFVSPRPAHALIFYVPCDVNALINTLREAMKTPSSDTLELTGGCTYSLRKVDNDSGNGGNGLPAITDDISINGNGAVIERNNVNDAPLFRLFYVAPKATLHLNQITLRNGKLAQNGTCPTTCGGAIYNAGILEIQNSTLTNNLASNGGAIYNVAKADLLNTTLVGNTANVGGALMTNGGSSELVVVHVTLVGNTAEQGGNAIATQTRGLAIVRGTLIVGSKGTNCLGTIGNGGFNLDSGTSCGFSVAAGSMSNTDPQIGVLTNNGGATETVIILDTSPALNAIPSLYGCGAAVYTDQRGGARPEVPTSLCDIGAVEVPEWDTLLLCGTGLSGLAIWLRAKRKRRSTPSEHQPSTSAK